MERTKRTRQRIRPEATRNGPLLARAACATVACGMSVLLPTGAAEATPRPAQPLAGVTITCGAKVLTFTAGEQVGDLRRVMLGSGDQVVIVGVVLHGAALVDDQGAEFRAVGAATSTARVPVATGGAVTGHFNVNLTVLGDDGLLGRVWLRERLLRDGSDLVLSGGGCSF